MTLGCLSLRFFLRRLNTIVKSTQRSDETINPSLAVSEGSFNIPGRRCSFLRPVGHRKQRNQNRNKYCQSNQEIFLRVTGHHELVQRVGEFNCLINPFTEFSQKIICKCVIHRHVVIENGRKLSLAQVGLVPDRGIVRNGPEDQSPRQHPNIANRLKVHAIDRAALHKDRYLLKHPLRYFCILFCLFKIIEKYLGIQCIHEYFSSQRPGQRLCRFKLPSFVVHFRGGKRNQTSQSDTQKANYGLKIPRHLIPRPSLCWLFNAKPHRMNNNWQRDCHKERNAKFHNANLFSAKVAA